MKKWGDLSVRVRLMSMVFASIASLFVVVAMTFASFRAIGVESTLSRQDRLLANVGGDFEDPAASLLNPYPLASQALRAKSHEDVDKLAKGVHDMRASYEASLARYERDVTDPALHAAIQDAHAAGESWYDSAEKQFFPALAAGQTKEANDIWQNQMEPLYQKHDATIAKITDMVNSGADATDKKVDTNERTYRWIMGIVSILASALVFSLGWITARQIWKGLEQVNQAMQTLSENDLTAKLELTSKDEIGQLASSYNHAIEQIRTTLRQVTDGAANASSAAQQLAAASESIASGSQEQAASLEETSASLEEITATVRQSADNARQASQLAVNARESAERGQEVVSTAISAMAEINTASAKISDIISTIDEIAFQTNLLAVNAAVEAARAGEEGRGFAVVASEVRSLAQRSAVAAKEIKGLIQDSLRKVETGSELVNRSGETLQAIVGSVKRVTDIVGEIAAAAGEQSAGVEQVNTAVTQMDQVTQANSAQTEELSATAQSLSEQSAHLLELVSTFTLSTGENGIRNRLFGSSQVTESSPSSLLAASVQERSSTGKQLVKPAKNGGSSRPRSSRAAKSRPPVPAAAELAIAASAGGSVSDANFEEF